MFVPVVAAEVLLTGSDATHVEYLDQAVACRWTFLAGLGYSLIIQISVEVQVREGEVNGAYHRPRISETQSKTC